MGESAGDRAPSPVTALEGEGGDRGGKWGGALGFREQWGDMGAAGGLAWWPAGPVGPVGGLLFFLSFVFCFQFSLLFCTLF